MQADITPPSQRVFSPLTSPILKTIINLQKCIVQSCHHRYKGSYTGELHCLLLQPRRQPYLIRSREDFDACGMVVHSGLYIQVSSSIHHDLLDLVIIIPPANFVCRGYTVFTLSVRASVRPSVRS